MGTTSPQAKLHVAGPVRIGAYTLPATDGTNGQTLVTNGSGVVSWQIAGGEGYTSYYTGNGQPSQRISFGTPGFRPSAVWIYPTSGWAIAKTDSMPGQKAFSFGTTGDLPNLVRIEDDGITVYRGITFSANTRGVTYYYVAIR
jgi:hypothetical protein